MTVASPAMRELDPEREGVRWITPETVMAHPLEDGSAIALRRDVAETTTSLGGAAGVVEAILSPLPPVAAPLRLTAALRRDGVDWVRRGLGSIEAAGPGAVRRRPPRDRLAVGRADERRRSVGVPLQ
jgi:phytoene dehydrogenase-like protein